MEQLSYRFIFLFAIGIVVVSLSHVMENHTPLDILRAIYENSYSPQDDPPPGKSRPPYLTKPVYQTPVLSFQAFPGAIYQNVLPPVMQPAIRNQMDQGHIAAPLQDPPVQTQQPLNDISLPDKGSSGKAPPSPDYSPHQYCQKYLKQAAEKTGILPEILWAVAKTESNYKGGPWPWTINVSGKGHYFPSQETARKFLKSLDPDKKYRVDVGCMQVNWGYHGEEFPYLSSMLNPRVNTMYGARFLKKLYQETGNWAKAIAAYHSRNQRLGYPYATTVAHQVQKYPQ